MKSRDIALAFIRREVEDAGELTVFALRAAQEHRISHTAMMAAAQEGLRRRARRAAQALPAPSERKPTLIPPRTALMTSQNRITEAEAAITGIRADMVRHERLLEDARQGGASSNEIQSIETLIANDHALIAAWERQIAAAREAASDPELIELRQRVDALSFEECVVALITRPNAGPLSVPTKTPESLQRLRDFVFDEARAGRVPLVPKERQGRAPKRLPIVTIDGKRYFRDDRLREYRAVDNPHDRLPL